jgi:creatinine amidohydrolase
VATGVLLENLTWLEAKEALGPETIVLIPLGAAAKEHGPHLKLKNDFTIAEYFKNEILKRSNVVVVPTVAYSFYPAFVDYPGSISLTEETSARMFVEICQSLAKFGPRKFYALNTGISTRRCLRLAAERLAPEGITLAYTDWEGTMAATVRDISQQEGGTHADEIETSMMLQIAPSDVDMSKAVKDFDKAGSGRLSPHRVAGLTYSPSGVWGDATLATPEKGARVVQSLIDGILRDIEDLRKSPALAASD